MKIYKDEVFVSDFDGLNIHYDIYEPGDNDNGIVIQGMHGMCEHKERYEGFGKCLAEQGFTLVMSAHRGHKGGVSSKEDYGYMGVDGLHGAREDGHQLTNIIKAKYPNKKVVLFGHSMGSLIARLYFQQYADELSGLIVCGSPAPNGAAKIAQGLCSVIRSFKGPKGYSKFINDLAFGSYNKRTSKKTEFDWLSVDENNVKFYIEDEACGFPFSIQSFYDLMGGIAEVYGDYPKPLKNPGCPVLFVAGKEDACGSYGEGVVKAREHMLNQGVKNVHIKLYDNMRHEILNEVNWNDVVVDIVDFVNDTVKEKA